MKVASLLSICAVALIVTLALAASSVVDSASASDNEFVRIGVTFRPAECTRKTKKGDSLSMHYTGKLEDGTVFDSSVDRGTPFTFTLGAGQVIKGWDQGLNGMCIGEKRRLKIPASLGYGARGSPPKIPGGATLIFEVELINIE